MSVRCKAFVAVTTTACAVLAFAGGSAGAQNALLTSRLVAPPVTRPLGSARRGLSATPGVLLRGMPTVVNPNRSPSFALPDAAAQTAIAVSDVGTNAVYAYTAAGRLTAQITALSAPQGLAFDAAGDLFIAETGKGDILEYSSDLRTEKAILSDPNEFPAAVAIDSATGLVGVTNILSAPNGGVGSVSLYANGAKMPCVTVYNAVFTRLDFGAFDAVGNFYVDGQRYDGSFAAGVVRGGCKATTITPLAIGNAVFFPGGVQVTPGGDIAILDQFAGAIYTYGPPVNGSLGFPRSRTPLWSLLDPIGFGFTKSAARLWVADAGFFSPQKSIPGTVDLYGFPQGKAPLATIRGLTSPTGIAVTPIERP